MENIITRIMAVPKGPGTARLKAELEQTIEEGGLQKFTRVYSDGFVMEDRVECSVMYSPEEIKIRLAEQMCIFKPSEVIIATRRWRIEKRIVITDSLSNLMAQETLYN
jgi:hypothetical protein